MMHAVEAVLFAAGKFVEEEYIGKILQADKKTVKKALEELREHYESRDDTALRVTNEDSQWKLTVRDEYLGIASKLVSDTEIQGTVLETLAVIAWKNPIMQSELIKIRGPAAYEHIAELAERGFVTKVPSGRTFKLTLQEKFFQYFDVEGREDMRKLFGPIAQHAEAQQADIDAQQKAYEEKVELAEEAAENPDSPEAARLRESEHSAQNKSTPSLIDEVKAAAKLLGSAPIPEVGEVIDHSEEGDAPEAEEGEEQRTAGNDELSEEVIEAEKAVDEFGEELDELKREVDKD
jgi:segregation and condensation protein B